MKILTIIFLLIGIITFNSCKKEPAVILPVETEVPVVVDTNELMIDTVWMYYDETLCADPWGGAHYDSEEEKKTNIENYFIDLGVEILEIEISNEGVSEPNFVCVSKSGNVIKCYINEEDANTLINEGFYQ